jgi:uncharacterized protein (TIGR03083 family)
MGEYGSLYAAGREQLIDLVGGLSPERAATVVPTCPAWTVKDAFAHVAGVAADIIEGRLDGVASDPWTAAQVEARRDATVADIAEEWRRTGPQIDAIVDSFGPTGAQLLFDLTTHEHDVRLALGQPGGRDAPVLDVALGFAVPNQAAHVPHPLRIRAEHLSWDIGDGEPIATLTTDRFTLMRAMSGRRSPAQIRALDWSGDPTPFLPMFAAGPFTFPANDVVE